MFKSARLIVGICLFGGVSLLALVGWISGFFGKFIGFIGGAWAGITAWLSQPLTFDHLLAGLGVLLIPIGILIAIFAITDN